MHTFTRQNPTDGTKLHGRVLASPKKPRAAIAIVHGFGEHTGRYTPVAERLGQQGLAVLGLDLHGHGRTPGPRGYTPSYERLREDVDMLLAETRSRYPDLPFYLWGHSMGGGLVLDYVFKRGSLKRDGSHLAGAIATAPLIVAADPPPAPLFFLFRLLEKIAPKFAIRNPIQGEQISTLPEEQALYAADELNHDRLSMRFGLSILQAGDSLARRSEPFPVPLLLMHSNGDTLTSFAASEAFAAARPDCNFHAFADVAHELHNDSSRDTVVRLIADFVRDTSEHANNSMGETA